MKRTITMLTALFTLVFFVNVSFAFDPYADEDVEQKSNKKLYYGIVLTLIGGFLACDGFSREEVDISKPMVDYVTVLHSEWTQNTSSDYKYTITSGESGYQYEIDGQTYTVENNVIYNNGNVDLKNVTVEVRYKYSDGSIIEDSDYHVAATFDTISQGQKVTWTDSWQYGTEGDSPPNNSERNQTDPTDLTGLNLGTNALDLADIKITLNKDSQYEPVYEKRNKSDIEGVAGIMIGITGIYFIVDHFLDMHKFNQYMKKNNLNIRLAKAQDEYKLLLQKRL